MGNGTIQYATNHIMLMVWSCGVPCTLRERIFLRVYWWKNFENRFTFAKVIIKNQVTDFLRHRVYVYLLLFLRHSNLLVENLRFSSFSPTSVSFKAIVKGFSWDQGYESGIKRPFATRRWNRIILYDRLLWVNTGMWLVIKFSRNGP